MADVVVAAVQAAPVLLDLDATLHRVQRYAEEAAGASAGLVVFPEAFVPGYPDWVWRARPWDATSQRLYGGLVDASVEIPGPAIDRLAEIARSAGLWMVVGATERKGSTLYNSLLWFDSVGELVHVHRKLMPTGGERLVWGYGDGSSLRVLDTPLGRTGGLICWENYMPLARAALYGQGLEVHLAPTWDTSDVWVPTLQHIAKEGRCFVVGVCQAIRASDLPADLPGRDELWSGNEWLARGLSTIVAPGGAIIAGPVVEEQTLLTATIDVARAKRARGMFDPTGHYGRPDVLRLVVDGRVRESVAFADAEDPGAGPRDQSEGEAP